jgi:hypothetical protein
LPGDSVALDVTIAGVEVHEVPPMPAVAAEAPTEHDGGRIRMSPTIAVAMTLAAATRRTRLLAQIAPERRVGDPMLVGDLLLSQVTL